MSIGSLKNKHTKQRIIYWCELCLAGCVGQVAPRSMRWQSMLIPGEYAMQCNRFVVAAFAVVVIGPFLLGNGSPVLRDARFTVTGVELSGPTTIANGTSASYTVKATIHRDSIPAGDVIAAPPSIRLAIYSGGAQLTFADVTFPPHANSVTDVLTLFCQSGEVRGNVAGSGHGGRGQFLWWSWDDPAEVRGHLNETESMPMRVQCR